MLAAMDITGNASSVHGEGRAAHKLIDEAREAISGALGVIAPMVVFTSGGSEANNLAIKGAAVDRLIISAIEHPSVMEAAKAWPKARLAQTQYRLPADAVEGVAETDRRRGLALAGRGRGDRGDEDQPAVRPVRQRADVIQ